jgi:hypothetical protein
MIHLHLVRPPRSKNANRAIQGTSEELARCVLMRVMWKEENVGAGCSCHPAGSIIIARLRFFYILSGLG